MGWTAYIALVEPKRAGGWGGWGWGSEDHGFRLDPLARHAAVARCDQDRSTPRWMAHPEGHIGLCSLAASCLHGGTLFILAEIRVLVGGALKKSRRRRCQPVLESLLAETCWEHSSPVSMLVARTNGLSSDLDRFLRCARCVTGEPMSQYSDIYSFGIICRSPSCS